MNFLNKHKVDNLPKTISKEENNSDGDDGSDQANCSEDVNVEMEFLTIDLTARKKEGMTENLTEDTKDTTCLPIDYLQPFFDTGPSKIDVAYLDAKLMEKFALIKGAATLSLCCGCSLCCGIGCHRKTPPIVIFTASRNMLAPCHSLRKIEETQLTSSLEQDSDEVWYDDEFPELMFEPDVRYPHPDTREQSNFEMLQTNEAAIMYGERGAYRNEFNERHVY